jgi:DNA-nicking Smr family endonuclease
MTSEDKKKTADKPAESFAELMPDVTPIAHNRVAPARKKRRPEPLNLPIGDEEREELADLSIETGDFLEFKRDGIQNRLFDDLRRGYIEVESVLDMHGMRVVDAA